ncbi:hypothetical protein UT300003_32630 [Clostridium sardiniense]
MIDKIIKDADRSHTKWLIIYTFNMLGEIFEEKEHYISPKPSNKFEVFRYASEKIENSKSLIYSRTRKSLVKKDFIIEVKAVPIICEKSNDVKGRAYGF